MAADPSLREQADAILAGVKDYLDKAVADGRKFTATLTRDALDGGVVDGVQTQVPGDARILITVASRWSVPMPAEPKVARKRKSRSRRRGGGMSHIEKVLSDGLAAGVFDECDPAQRRAFAERWDAAVDADKAEVQRLIDELTSLRDRSA
jgi:hypothetical protein